MSRISRSIFGRPGDKDTLEIKPAKEYAIRKIILNDGTEYDIKKGIVGVIILKDSETNNQITFKVSYYATEEYDLFALSNESVMVSYALKALATEGIPFEDGCKRFKKLIYNFRDGT